MIDEIPESEFKPNREIEGNLITAATCAVAWPKVFTKALTTWTFDRAIGATNERARRSLMYRVSEDMYSSVAKVDDVFQSLKDLWKRI